MSGRGKKKLQLNATIENTLKQVDASIKAVDELWTKLEQVPKREKIEEGIKAEVRKLQKHRENIRSWIANKDTKDTSKLEHYRRLIETEMERLQAQQRGAEWKGHQGVDSRAWIHRAAARQQKRLETIKWEMSSAEGKQSTSKHKRGAKHQLLVTQKYHLDSDSLNLMERLRYALNKLSANITSNDLSDDQISKICKERTKIEKAIGIARGSNESDDGCDISGKDSDDDDFRDDDDDRSDRFGSGCSGMYSDGDVGESGDAEESSFGDPYGGGTNVKLEELISKLELYAEGEFDDDGTSTCDFGDSKKKSKRAGRGEKSGETTQGTDGNQGGQPQPPGNQANQKDQNGPSASERSGKSGNGSQGAEALTAPASVPVPKPTCEIKDESVKRDTKDAIDPQPNKNININTNSTAQPTENTTGNTVTQLEATKGGPSIGSVSPPDTQIKKDIPPAALPVPQQTPSSSSSPKPAQIVTAVAKPITSTRERREGRQNIWNMGALLHNTANTPLTDTATRPNTLVNSRAGPVVSSAPVQQQKQVGKEQNGVRRDEQHQKPPIVPVAPTAPATLTTLKEPQPQPQTQPKAKAQTQTQTQTQAQGQPQPAQPTQPPKDGEREKRGTTEETQKQQQQRQTSQVPAVPHSSSASGSSTPAEPNPTQPPAGTEAPHPLPPERPQGLSLVGALRKRVRATRESLRKSRMRGSRSPGGLKWNRGAALETQRSMEDTSSESIYQPLQQRVSTAMFSFNNNNFINTFDKSFFHEQLLALDSLIKEETESYQPAPRRRAVLSEHTKGKAKRQHKFIRVLPDDLNPTADEDVLLRYYYENRPLQRGGGKETGPDNSDVLFKLFIRQLAKHYLLRKNFCLIKSIDMWVDMGRSEFDWGTKGSCATGVRKLEVINTNGRGRAASPLQTMLGIHGGLNWQQGGQPPHVAPPGATPEQGIDITDTAEEPLEILKYASPCYSSDSDAVVTDGDNQEANAAEVVEQCSYHSELSDRNDNSLFREAVTSAVLSKGKASKLFNTTNHHYFESVEAAGELLDAREDMLRESTEKFRSGYSRSVFGVGRGKMNDLCNCLGIPSDNPSPDIEGEGDIKTDTLETYPLFVDQNIEQVRKRNHTVVGSGNTQLGVARTNGKSEPGAPKVAENEAGVNVRPPDGQMQSDNDMLAGTFTLIDNSLTHRVVETQVFYRDLEFL